MEQRWVDFDTRNQLPLVCMFTHMQLADGPICHFGDDRSGLRDVVWVLDQFVAERILCLPPHRSVTAFVSTHIMIWVQTNFTVQYNRPSAAHS